MENEKEMNQITTCITSCSDCKHHDYLISSKLVTLKYSSCSIGALVIKEHLEINDYPIPDDCPLLRNPFVGNITLPNQNRRSI